jgi:protein-tyrosine phosphatase
MLESYTPEGTIIVDVRDLNDSAENTIEVVKRKIILIANLLGCGERVIIRCMAGMSRSNTLACAALILFSLEHGWDHYWNEIQEKCPRARQNLEFVDVVKKALLELGVDRKRLYYD